MAAKKFILRVETSRGRKRVTLDSDQVSFSDFQSQLFKDYGVKPEEQILSRQPPSNPDFIEVLNNSASLSKCGFKHGDLIYLIMGKNHLSNFLEQQRKLKEAETNELKKNAYVPTTNTSSSNIEEKKSDDMKIDSGGNIKKGQYKLSSSNTRKIPNKVTLETSEWVNDPKHKIIDNGPKHTPFHKWIQDRQKKYSNQPWNIDPPKFDYHSVPYKGNVAFKDLPANAVVKRQEYRHCDVICFQDSTPFKRFKINWEKDSTYQRMAYLIGRHKVEPNTLETGKNAAKDRSDTLMYANVYAMYTPPQKGHMRGVKLMKDPNEKSVDLIVNACGMERIGWIITTLPRGGKEYHGDIFMSGDEIYTAARLQEKYKNQNTGYSKFISLVTHLGSKEPQAFQISDQGVAMIRYGLVKPNNDPGFLEVSKPPERVYVPSVINENSEIKPGKTFLPDAMLVNVIATQTNKEEHIFNFVHFPANGDLDALKNHLQYHKDEEYHVSLSDFYLLCYLPRVIDKDLAVKVAQHVVKKQRLDSNTRDKLHNAFRNLGLVS